ncbi:hypothetical protein [Polyangium jinanense]|uniref:Uncharacterized protein n=1 Tax=Polyangium jinanense TaxID=2829994 RepID=A0A9X3XEV3_9BACT|nr:hypothetical protein [Polyangium jinanense]MDC3960496.1 hypothetical protein [Polyangium jinanense]MDC3986731.1 hypothetical protein [Polyangium jinanense]
MNGTMLRPAVLYVRGKMFVLGTRHDDLPAAPLEGPAAEATVAKLLGDPVNYTYVRSFLSAVTEIGAQSARDKDVLPVLVRALQRGTLKIAELPIHPTTSLEIKKTGKLTLSEVSWGETAGIYPTKTSKPTEQEKYNPAQWDDAKLLSLMKARAAIHDVAKRNSQVRKNSNFSKFTNFLKPYHCIENFPPLDPEITQDVKWFYISSKEKEPSVHPGTSGTELVKSYGEFYCNGGGDVKKGAAYILFYKKSS